MCTFPCFRAEGGRLHKLDALMVLLIPPSPRAKWVGGWCVGGEGEGRVMDFWQQLPPVGPNRQQGWWVGRYALGQGSKVGDMPPASPLSAGPCTGHTQQQLEKGAERRNENHVMC